MDSARYDRPARIRERTKRAVHGRRDEDFVGDDGYGLKVRGKLIQVKAVTKYEDLNSAFLLPRSTPRTNLCWPVSLTQQSPWSSSDRFVDPTADSRDADRQIMLQVR